MLVKVNHPSPQKCEILHISPHPCAKIPDFSAFLNLQTTFLRPQFWGFTMPWCPRMKPSRSSWCPTVSWFFEHHRATGEDTADRFIGVFPEKEWNVPLIFRFKCHQGLCGFKCCLFLATEAWRWFFPDLTLRIILRLGLRVQVPQRLDNIHSIPFTNCRDRKITKKKQECGPKLREHQLA